jgi:ParB family transcriptional regulator, chromosome partitioning protein
MDNPYNSRVEYDQRTVQALADSIESVGLQVPIRVRRNADKYELVFGHRRVRAARSLGMSSIDAEIASVSDEEMLVCSLVENLQRNELTDFEKALSFAQLRIKFGKTYEEIGKLSGLSPAHVCNYVRMTTLFDEENLSSNPGILRDLHRITERHSRELLTIEDQRDRANALRLAVSQSLSVKDLRRVVHRLRGLFEPEAQAQEYSDHELLAKTSRGSRSYMKEIEDVISSIYKLPRDGDFQAFADLHAYDEGFTIYSQFPPFDRFDHARALDKERNWFYNIAPNFAASVRDLHVQLFNNTALATLYVDFLPKGASKARKARTCVRGSVFFIRRDGTWKIIHEHWSNFSGDGNPQIMN